jgi:hypothetical protein
MTYYTIEIDGQEMAYICSLNCITKLWKENGITSDESVIRHFGKGDPENCDSLLCERVSV